MPTTEQIQAIFSSAHTGNDFPRIATELKNTGIRGFSYHIASGNTLCYDDEGETLTLSGSRKLDKAIAQQKNLARLSHSLREYRAGLTDFTTFSQQAAEAGVNLWVADLNRMTISYFTSSGYLIREETISEILNSSVHE